MVELSHPYTTTAKTIALTIGMFGGKVMYSKSHQSLAIREAGTYRVYSVFISHVFSSSCSITVSQDRDIGLFIARFTFGKRTIYNHLYFKTIESHCWRYQ